MKSEKGCRKKRGVADEEKKEADDVEEGRGHAQPTPHQGSSTRTVESSEREPALL